MTAAQLAEYKKIKAELREARTEDRVLEKKRRPSSAAGVPVKARYAYIHREEGNYPTRLMCHCLGGVAFRLLRLAQQGYVGNPETP